MAQATLRGVACTLLVGAVAIMPPVVAAPAAQSASSEPGMPQTDQQFRGEALFLKNCALCHIHTAQKRALKIQASTELIGHFKKPTTTETSARQVLQRGVPGLMPAFQYALSPNDIDDLVAYLKIR